MGIILEYLYSFIIVCGRVVVISSSSWYVVWFGFELNMLSFIVLFGSKGKIVLESIFKYFFVQVVGSILILFMCMVMGLGAVSDLLLIDYFIERSVFLVVMVWKIGGGPFFFWLPVVAEGLDWFGNFVLLTWQKISALWIISLISFEELILFFLGVRSVIIGCFGGLNQILIKKIFVYSSVAHIGWILLISFMSINILMFYYIFYVILRGALVGFFINKEIYYVNHLFIIKGKLEIILFLFIRLFSLGGLPPILGFYPKWLGLLLLLRGEYIFVCFLIIMLGVVSLYYYLRLGYGWILFLSFSCKWVGYFRNIIVLSVLLMGISCFSLFYFSLSFI